MLGSIATTTLRWPTHVRQKAPCLQRVDNKKNAAIGRSEAHCAVSRQAHSIQDVFVYNCVMINLSDPVPAQGQAATPRVGCSQRVADCASMRPLAAFATKPEQVGRSRLRTPAAKESRSMRIVAGAEHFARSPPSHQASSS